MPDTPTSSLPVIHSHNTLAHILAYVKQKPLQNSSDTGTVPVMRRLFDSIDVFQREHKVNEYQLFPIGSLAYERLPKFPIPSVVLNLATDYDKGMYIDNCKLDDLDPSGEIREWMAKQAFTLNHYLSRKMLKTNKTYAQIILDNLFPERQGSDELYKEYEYNLRQEYVEGFMMYATSIFSGTDENFSLVKTHFFGKIATLYAYEGASIGHLLSLIRDRESKKDIPVKVAEEIDLSDPNTVQEILGHYDLHSEDALKLINDIGVSDPKLHQMVSGSYELNSEEALKITRCFDDLDHSYFPLPLFEYDNFKQIDIADSYLQLKRMNHIEDEDVTKLYDLNFADPRSLWRNQLFVVLDKLDAYLYKKNQKENQPDITSIRLIFNTLFPDKANDNVFFEKTASTLRTAYFSSFIMCLARQLPEEVRDSVVTICGLIVKEAVKHEPGFILKEKAKPTVQIETVQPKVSEEEGLKAYTKALSERNKVFEDMKANLGLNNITQLEFGHYKATIDQVYKDLYTEEADGDFLIHRYIKKFVQECYPHLAYKDEYLYGFYDLWEKLVRSKLLKDITTEIGATPQIQKKIDLYITAKEGILQKQHQKITDKEYHKLMRTLGRFADRARCGWDGLYLDAKYHAIHDISKQIKEELHTAYSQRRLLSSKEKRLLKYRCLGLVDSEMKVVFQERVTKGVLHHLAKKFKQWRDNLGKLFDSSTKLILTNVSSSRIGEENSRSPSLTPSDKSDISDLSSLSSTSEAPRQSKTTPAKTHYRWKAFEAEFEELEEAGIAEDSPAIKPNSSIASPAA